MAIRKKEWKQANPKDQTVALLATVEGYLSNMLDGIYDPRPDILRARLFDCRGFVEDAQALVKDLPPGEWEKLNHSL